MGEQLSLKAAMPLAEILATCRKNVSNTGPWCGQCVRRCRKRIWSYVAFHYRGYHTSHWTPHLITWWYKYLSYDNLLFIYVRTYKDHLDIAQLQRTSLGQALLSIKRENEYHVPDSNIQISIIYFLWRVNLISGNINTTIMRFCK